MTWGWGGIENPDFDSSSGIGWAKSDGPWPIEVPPNAWHQYGWVTTFWFVGWRHRIQACWAILRTGHLRFRAEIHLRLEEGVTYLDDTLIIVEKS